MKRLILISAIALLGCHKKHCYTCVTEPYPKTQAVATVITETKCEITSKEAKDYEQLHTTANSICKCTQQ